MAPPGLRPFEPAEGRGALHAEADGLVRGDAGGDLNEHVGVGVGAAAEAAQQPAERVPPDLERAVVYTCLSASDLGPCAPVVPCHEPCHPVAVLRERTLW